MKAIIKRFFIIVVMVLALSIFAVTLAACGDALDPRPPKEGDEPPLAGKYVLYDKQIYEQEKDTYFKFGTEASAWGWFYQGTQPYKSTGSIQIDEQNGYAYFLIVAKTDGTNKIEHSIPKGEKEFVLDGKKYVHESLLHKVIFNIGNGRGLIRYVQEGETIEYLEKQDVVSKYSQLNLSGLDLVGWYNDGTDFSEENLFNFASTPIKKNIELYSLWGGSFTVSFVENGGSLTGQNPITIKMPIKEDVNLRNEYPVQKAGYEFLGWMNKDEIIDELTKGQMYPNLQLTAKWKPCEYNITYRDVGNPNVFSGDFTGCPTKHTYDTSTILTAPTRLGYVFDGWFANSGGLGEAITTLGKTDYTDNITLYAKWSGEQYDLIYRDLDNPYAFNGDSSGCPTTHTYGTKTILSAPTRAGYIFEGWFEKKAGEDIAIFFLDATDYTDNIILYAKWTLKSDIGLSFNSNGGNAIIGKTLTFDSQYGELETPIKTEHVFEGWYLNDGTSNGVWGERITSATIVKNTNAHTLYARWTANTYTIFYRDVDNPDGFSGDSTGCPFEHVYGAKTNLVNPIKTGYTFLGWYKNSDGTGSAVAFIGATEYTNDITLYAKWTIKSDIALSFDSKGGSPVNTRELTYNTQYGELEVPSRGGYEFDAWYLKDGTSNGNWGEQVTATTIVKNDNAHKLYAKWIANIYTVTYESNKPVTLGTMSGFMESSTHTYDVVQTLLPNEFSLTGWNFQSWNTKPNGSGTSYSNSSAPKNLTTDTTIKLYAQWTRINYSIQYNLKQGSASNPISYTIDTETFTLTKPSLQNSLFVGWTGSEISGTVETVTIKKGTIGNKTYTANYLTTLFKSISEYSAASNAQKENCTLDLQNFSASTNTVFTIATATKQVEIIGKNTVINNFRIHVATRVTTLTITLNKMKWKSHSGAALESQAGNSTLLTINLIASNEIQGLDGKENENGQAAIKVENLKITGSGSLTVKAGKGGLGKSYTTLRSQGGTGGNGGDAIFCTHLEVSGLSGKVKIVGGAGGNGGAEGDGGQGGRYGETNFLRAGRGGDGGHAVNASGNVNIDGGSAVMELTGGSGGNGRDGKVAKIDHMAGSGGHGGQGGCGIYASASVTIKNVSVTGGKCGNGGNGGEGKEDRGLGIGEGNGGNGGVAKNGTPAITSKTLTKNANVILIGGNGGRGGIGGKGKVYNMFGSLGSTGTTHPNYENEKGVEHLKLN